MHKSSIQTLLISIVVALGSCDPCDDCNATVFEPTINVVFINQDSLDAIALESTQIAAERLILEEELDEIDSILRHLNERITELNQRIADGEDLEFERNQAQDSVNDFNQRRVGPQTQVNALDSTSTVLSEVASVINTGLIRVSTIEILETGSLVPVSEDSATSFSVPLSFEKSFLNYAVTIGTEVNTFAVDYELFREVDVDRNVLTRARNIAAMITNDSFDSLAACQENCLDGQSTFTFFF